MVGVIAKPVRKGRQRRDKKLLERYDQLVLDFKYEIAHMSLSTDTTSVTESSNDMSSSTISFDRGLPKYAYYSTWNAMYEKEFTIKEQLILKKLLEKRNRNKAE